ncbi:hypothetical protein [Bacillus salacetis]
MTAALFEKLNSEDKSEQYDAYQGLMEKTKYPVPWAYEVWDGLKEDLSSKDAHKRSRAAQFLSQLAISDPEERMLNDFSDVWEVTRDRKFVTARHVLQSIWRVGMAGREQRKMVLNRLIDRYKNCMEEKNHTLIRNDILIGMRELYKETKEESIKVEALKLIKMEKDKKYLKKYEGIWKNT